MPPVNPPSSGTTRDKRTTSVGRQQRTQSNPSHESFSDSKNIDMPLSDNTEQNSQPSTRHNSHPSPEDSIIVEVIPSTREWNRTHQSTPQKTIIPFRKGNSLRPKKGNMVRIIRQFAEAKGENAPLLSRFGKVAGGLTALAAGSTVSVGITSTAYGNKQAMTAIALASVWARHGHRTLLVNVDPANRTLIKTVGKTTPTLGDLAEAMISGKRLPLPSILTDATDHLEFLCGYEDDWDYSRLADTGLLHQLQYILRTRYQRIVWSLPPLQADEWSPAMLRSIFDSLVLSAKRGRADLRLIEKLAEDWHHDQFPPLQIMWHD